jgi:transposase
LQQLSTGQLIELVFRLQRPDKDSRTSSKPPSTDRKEKLESARPGGAKLLHEPRDRRLADNPDLFRNYTPLACEHCGADFSSDDLCDWIGELAAIPSTSSSPLWSEFRSSRHVRQS